MILAAIKRLLCSHSHREITETRWDEAGGRVHVLQQTATCLRCGQQTGAVPRRAGWSGGRHDSAPAQKSIQGQLREAGDELRRVIDKRPKP